MADQGKGADLRGGDPYAETASTRPAPSPLTPSGEPENAAPVSGDRSDGRGALSDHTRNRLAAQLRAMYDTVALQPVPDRFAELIAKLDGGEREKA
jgi:hypothetical protein